MDVNGIYKPTQNWGGTSLQATETPFGLIKHGGLANPLTLGTETKLRENDQTIQWRMALLTD